MPNRVTEVCVADLLALEYFFEALVADRLGIDRRLRLEAVLAEAKRALAVLENEVGRQDLQALVALELFLVDDFNVLLAAFYHDLGLVRGLLGFWGI